MAQADSATVAHVVRAALQADAAVAAEVADRVFGAHLQDADAGTVGYPLIVVEVVGGTLHYAKAVQHARFDLWAYSRTSSAHARALYDLAVRALQMEVKTVSNVAPRVVCREESRGSSGYNDVARAWYCYGVWVGSAVGAST